MAGVDQLWPASGTIDANLRALYDYPPGLAAPFVRANFVASLDGVVSVDGRSRGLSDDADREVFALQRAMADVILVGAGTARAEGYRGARMPAGHAELRRELGLAPVPPIAVVTASCSFTPEHVLVADTVVAPIVITVAAAPAAHRDALTAAGVPVLIAGEERVDVAVAVRLLGERGLHRVLCEGGPTLFAALVSADLVDELALTVAPLLVAGTAARITDGAEAVARRLTLASAVHAEDALLLRYRRRAG